MEKSPIKRLSFVLRAVVVMTLNIIKMSLMLVQLLIMTIFPHMERKNCLAETARKCKQVVLSELSKETEMGKN
jgi:hypothetical protein|tara:strand:- start:623 stop:841 length:219 start_codon:yes stop_codon:yes gene_type:complete